MSNFLSSKQLLTINLSRDRLLRRIGSETLFTVAIITDTLVEYVVHSNFTVRLHWFDPASIDGARNSRLSIHCKLRGWTAQGLLGGENGGPSGLFGGTSVIVFHKNKNFVTLEGFQPSYAIVGLIHCFRHIIAFCCFRRGLRSRMTFSFSLILRSTNTEFLNKKGSFQNC